MFGVAKPEPGRVDWQLVEGDTFAVHAQKSGTGWDGRTWTATFRPRATAAADLIAMEQDDQSTTDGLDFAAWVDADGLTAGVYVYRISNTNPAATPAGKVSTFMWGAITVSAVD